MPNRLDVDTVVTSVLMCTSSLQVPTGSLTNTMIVASAGISASKVESYQKECWGQIGTAVTETKVLGMIRGSTGTTVGVEVTNQTACGGSSTVTVDVQKNGVSILSAVVTLNSASSITVPIAATVTTTALADGDIITGVITTVASGTDALATGVSVQWDWNEDHPSA